MSAAQSPVGRARLLAVAPPHSGDFLIDDSCLQADSQPKSGGLVWGSTAACPMLISLNAPRQFVIPHRDSATSWCANRAPHQCVCGENVNQYSVHGLSCRRSAGRHSRHSAVNNNNNNNPRTIFIVLSSWPLKVSVRVHSVHLMNAAQRTSGCRPSDQATWLGLWVRL